MNFEIMIFNILDLFPQLDHQKRVIAKSMKRQKYPNRIRQESESSGSERDKSPYRSQSPYYRDTRKHNTRKKSRSNSCEPKNVQNLYAQKKRSPKEILKPVDPPKAYERMNDIREKSPIKHLFNEKESYLKEKDVKNKISNKNSRGVKD